MSGAPKSRGMFQYVFKNFWNSLKVGKRQKVGNLVGRDPFGNVYYELPAQPELGKRRPTRWYNAETTGRKDIVSRDTWAGFDSDLPSEWESWLRYRRDNPPSDDEVLQGLALADMKKRNAAKLEVKRIDEMRAAGIEPEAPKPQDHEKNFYPKYDEFEVMPGERERLGEKDKWEEFKNPYTKPK
eukprot:TRINITY_DN11533_c0_g1_i2.p1 TRINITY_DN11533_c0_g1~~TRINITY_DN11533_c0_g1_i2.p1  ORF type:complete len:184 (+),score=37.50 TRINITY_DN11533_c0_g1_i2:45-596(+)